MITQAFAEEFTSSPFDAQKCVTGGLLSGNQEPQAFRGCPGTQQSGCREGIFDWIPHRSREECSHKGSMGPGSQQLEGNQEA